MCQELCDIHVSVDGDNYWFVDTNRKLQTGASEACTWQQEAVPAEKTARRVVPRNPAARCSTTTTLKTTLLSDQVESNLHHRSDSTMPMSTPTHRTTCLRQKPRQRDPLLALRRRPHGTEPCCGLHPFQEGGSDGYLSGCSGLGRGRKGPHARLYMQTQETAVLPVQIGIHGLGRRKVRAGTKHILTVCRDRYISSCAILSRINYMHFYVAV